MSAHGAAWEHPTEPSKEYVLSLGVFNQCFRPISLFYNAKKLSQKA